MRSAYLYWGKVADFNLLKGEFKYQKAPLSEKQGFQILADHTLYI